MSHRIFSFVMLPMLALPALGADGLIGRYYSGFSVVSNRVVFDGLTLMSTRTDTAFDHWNGSRFDDWNPIGNINYSVQWNGYLHITESGVYGFGTISDDGSEVWIDGERVVDNHEEQWFDWQEGYHYLGAGHHTIEITFYEARSYSGIEVWWLPPSVSPSSLPYSGENFHQTWPSFNSDTRWEILPDTVLSTEAPFLNPRLKARLIAGSDEVELTWRGFTNVNYFLESSTNLMIWQDVTGALPGISGVMTQMVDRAISQEFFRARLEPLEQPVDATIDNGEQ